MTDDTANGATPAAEIGYADALAELDTILRELEGSDVDVDRLAERVARAADLIAVCRDRIGAARMRIDDVIADLDEDVSTDVDRRRRRRASGCPRCRSSVRGDRVGPHPSSLGSCLRQLPIRCSGSPPASRRASTPSSLPNSSGGPNSIPISPAR